MSNPTRPEIVESHLRARIEELEREGTATLAAATFWKSKGEKAEATIKRLYDLLRADRRYRTLLQTEIARMSGFMYVHGQTTPQETVGAGKVCRDEIATLEAALTEGA